MTKTRKLCYNLKMSSVGNILNEKQISKHKIADNYIKIRTPLLKHLSIPQQQYLKDQ